MSALPELHASHVRDLYAANDIEGLIEFAVRHGYVESRNGLVKESTLLESMNRLVRTAFNDPDENSQPFGAGQ